MFCANASLDFLITALQLGAVVISKYAWFENPWANHCDNRIGIVKDDVLA
jgi:hypothetical protein